MPKRIQMTRQKPWRADNPAAVIVARPSGWGNPFAVGYHRHLIIEGGPLCIPIPDRATAVALFRKWHNGARFISLPKAPSAHDIRDTLAGYDLACWCPLDAPCHADVLLEIANPLLANNRPEANHVDANMTNGALESVEWQVLAHTKSGEEVDTGSPLGEEFARIRYEIHAKSGSRPTLRRRVKTVTVSDWETVEECGSADA